MKPELDIEIDRQALYSGEPVSGRVTITGQPSYKALTITLQGEEVLGANNVVGSLVFPILDLATRCEDKVAGFPFEFTLPEEAPPSYSSQDVRCQYVVK